MISSIRHVGLVLLQHRAPDMEVQRIQIKRIRWPFILFDEVWRIVFKLVLRKPRRVSRRAVLLEDEVVRRLHFVAEKAMINADYYVQNLLPNLIEDCRNLASNNFIFQKDGAPVHTSRFASQLTAVTSNINFISQRPSQITITITALFWTTKYLKGNQNIANS